MLNNTGNTTPAIRPCRGIYLQPGMVVKPTPAQACRVESIQRSGPLTMSGWWSIIDERADILKKPELCRVPFTLYQDCFYTVESEANHAR